jgi:hypothetical protein
VNGADLLFVAAFAGLLIHEMDAIRCGEWRFFFQKVPLSDASAYRLFTAAHAPLVILILVWMEEPALQITLDIFLIAHAGLHWWLRNHPLLDFSNWFSAIWIYGAAILGALHLVMLAVGAMV